MNSKGHVVLVDIPDDASVKFNGKKQKIELVTAINNSTSSGGILFKYPGVRVKLLKNSLFEIESDGRVGKTKIETKPAVGTFIWSGIITLGISPIIDLATKSYLIPKNKFDKYIDAKAIIEGTEPRTGIELRTYLYNLDWKNDDGLKLKTY